ncbi:hypothetical protein IJD15_07400 [bacterium]|nr:hypothetical protein [bacterium]
MKKFLWFFIFFVSLNTLHADCSDKLDSKNQSFMDLGRYIETLEINERDENIDEINNTSSDNSFEEEAIKNVAQRYEENAIELKLDEIDDDALDVVNNERVFKLKINETQYSIEQNIKTENMYWYGSKLFTQAFVHTSKKLAPIPGVVNSSSISAQVTPDLSATIGQTYLFNSLGPSVLFVRANESMYNTGSVISYKGEGLNLSVGSFSASYNHSSSGGAILATDSIFLPKNAGSFVLGGAYFANEAIEDNKTTGGAFAEYTYRRLKLNAQVGKSKLSNALEYDTSLYFVPELQLTDSVSIKTRFIRNVTQDSMQDELALTYKPKNSTRNFEFEINASNQYTNTETIKQRIKLSTTFRI